MKRIVFLDFDGVLNTENHQMRLCNEGKPLWDDYGQLFDPEAVNNLKIVLDTYKDVLLIISSSWKMEGFDTIQELWKVRGLPGKLVGITPDFVPDLTTIDLTDNSTISLLAGKGYEIKQWLEENDEEECKYVIFDDVPDFLPEQEPNLIRTDPRVGITKENAIEAIRILA